MAHKEHFFFIVCIHIYTQMYRNCKVIKYLLISLKLLEKLLHIVQYWMCYVGGDLIEMFNQHHKSSMTDGCHAS